MLLRVRNAAVGRYDGSFLGYPIGESQLFKNWVSGEIWADDHLEDAMNIDRRTLRVTHPAYVELQSAFHRWFSGFLLEVRKELYARESSTRRLEGGHRRRRGRACHRSATSRKRCQASVAQAVHEAWGKPTPEGASDKRAVRRLTRKYSVGELYEIVLDFGRGTHEKDAFESFVRELTHRLSD